MQVTKFQDHVFYVQGQYHYYKINSAKVKENTGVLAKLPSVRKIVI